MEFDASAATKGARLVLELIISTQWVESCFVNRWVAKA